MRPYKGEFTLRLPCRNTGFGDITIDDRSKHHLCCAEGLKKFWDDDIPARFILRVTNRDMNVIGKGCRWRPITMIMHQTNDDIRCLRICGAYRLFAPSEYITQVLQKRVPYPDPGRLRQHHLWVSITVRKPKKKGKKQ